MLIFDDNGSGNFLKKSIEHFLTYFLTHIAEFVNECLIFCLDYGQSLIEKLTIPS